MQNKNKKIVLRSDCIPKEGFLRRQMEVKNKTKNSSVDRGFLRVDMSLSLKTLNIT